MKKFFKMPTAYTILFVLIAAVAVLMHIIPAGIFEKGVYKINEHADYQGVWQVLAAPVQGFFDASDIIVFVLAIGGFLGVVMKTGALDAGIAKLLKVFKGKEQLLIPILMFFFGIGGTTYGMAEETIAFYPLIITVFLLAGFDVVTAVMVVLLGSGVGVLASTVNPFATGVAASAANVSMGDGLIHRVVLFIVLETLAILWTLKYAAKVRADKSKSIVADLHEEQYKHFTKGKDLDGAKFETKHGVVLTIFGLTFVTMILGIIPWALKFGVMIFDSIYNKLAVAAPFLGLYPNTADGYWAKWEVVKTHPSALGDWMFGQMAVLFVVSAIIVGIVGRLKESEIVDAFVDGAKDLLGVAIIIAVSRGIKIVMVAGGMDATVLYYGAETLKDMSTVAFINLTYLFYIPMSFLIPSTSGLAGASMPIMGPLGDAVIGKGAGAQLVITAFSAASGVVNLITPTSGVVMGALAIAKLPYERWLKHMLGFLAIASLIVMMLLTASLFIGVY